MVTEYQPPEIYPAPLRGNEMGPTEVPSLLKRSRLARLGVVLAFVAWFVVGINFAATGHSTTAFIILFGIPMGILVITLVGLLLTATFLWVRDG